MRCVVTAGPTYEPMDKVRRLTNFSTGRLGSELVHYLAVRGHEVTLLLGEQSTYRGEHKAQKVETFTTTRNLGDLLHALSDQAIDAVFHAAAVSDFGFGKIWERLASGELNEMKAGKLSTREGTLLAELIPTPKLIGELRQWFPKARLIGWKFEVDGRKRDVIRAADKQLAECLTDACVINGPAYGPGFGLCRNGEECLHLPDAPTLYEALEQFISA